VAGADAAGFGRALVGILSSPARRAVWGKASAARATRFTIGAMVDRTMAAYVKVGRRPDRGGDAAPVPVTAAATDAPRPNDTAERSGRGLRTSGSFPLIQRFVRATDATIARVYHADHRERGALITFLFHSLFRSEREIALNVVDPLQRTTLQQFRQFVEYYLRHGYGFVTPDELVGLPRGGRYALITFDDGYFNNHLALPILEEYRVPATFFISTTHVQENKSFWWDVAYREGVARGRSHRQIYRHVNGLKALKAEQVELAIAAEYGRGAFAPRGDIDRPFSPDELRALARSPYVRIGNHTADHAILTNYSSEQARAQVRGARDALREITGRSVDAIAYPNGAQDAEVVRMCRDLGLKVGFTTRPEKSLLPFDADSDDLLRLGRFAPHGGDAMLTQCRTYRSDVLLYGRFRDGYLRLFRRQGGR
jgi:peptidoglycan/xylan/chitin deacetylase (PgdA/CDA1 family)